jgi:hypothetical protein
MRHLPPEPKDLSMNTEDEDLLPGPPPWKPSASHPPPAGAAVLTAARIEAEAARAEPASAEWQREYAREIVEQVRTVVPREPTVYGELVPQGPSPGALSLRDTLARPDAVAADASRERLELANRAGVLEAALDVADTIEASNSLEKMLAHQLAVMHRTTMRLARQMERRLDRLEYANLSYPDADRTNVEAVRLANTVSRMTTTFQAGMLTLQKLRTGGTQRVIVEHMQQTVVQDGGQAVVAGKVKTGGQGRKRKGKQRTGVENG